MSNINRNRYNKSNPKKLNRNEQGQYPLEVKLLDLQKTINSYVALTEEDSKLLPLLTDIQTRVNDIIEYCNSRHRF